MAKIRLDPAATPHQVLEVVRATLEARDYLWDPTASTPGAGTSEARASEGGSPVSDLALPTSQRLRVRIRIQPERHRVLLDQETTGAAATGAATVSGAGPWLMIHLGRRFRKLVKAVRDDLAAASLTS